MATPAAATRGPIPVRDIAPRNDAASGHPKSRQSFQGELRTIRRTAQTGTHRARNIAQKLIKLHRDTAEIYDQSRSKHVSELTQVTVEALGGMEAPSIWRYGSFTIICVIVDVLVSPIVTASYASGPGAVAAIIIVGLSMWLTERTILGKKEKNTTEARKELQNKMTKVQDDIEEVKVEYEKFRRWAKLAKKRFPRVTAKLTSAGARMGRAARTTRLAKPVVSALKFLARILKHPLFKQIGEAIVVVNLAPLWTIGAIAAYIIHRSEFREAQRLLSEYSSAKGEIVGTTDDMYQTQLAVVEQELVDTTIDTREQEALASA